MTTTEASQLLEQFRAGKISQARVLQAFQRAPLADLGFAQVDLHRSLRKDFPEVIYGEGKTPAQVLAIAGQIIQREGRVLVTRIHDGHARVLRKNFAARFITR